MPLIQLCERGFVPDALTRVGIRRLNEGRLRELSAGGVEAQTLRQRAFLEALGSGEVAPHGESARVQHYEVPAAFFERALGPRLKYSACWYEPGADLATAEEAMLALTMERAGLEDGMRVLELGCGWGSASLWMAERYPASRITAVSNSASQKAFIDARARAAGFDNLEVVTCDVNVFEPEAAFERIVSVEMFEHMRNYAALLRRCRGWLAPDGRLFVHIFCHESQGYFFEDPDGDNSTWMAKHFFENGVMPNFDVFDAFQDDMLVQQRWWVDGTHYQRTAEDWLRRQDAARAELLPLFADHPDGAAIMFQRWRMFFLAVAEMFGTNEGRTWGVGHYLLAPRTL